MIKMDALLFCLVLAFAFLAFFENFIPQITGLFFFCFFHFGLMRE
jgi:hypothetical protein